MSKLYLFLKAVPFDFFFFPWKIMANLTRAHLGIKFPSGQHGREELLWKSKFEIIANIVMSCLSRLLMYARPQRLTFRDSLSWGRPGGSQGDELLLSVDSLWNGRRSGWRLAPEMGAFVLPASVRTGLDMLAGNVASEEGTFERHQNRH